MEVRKPLRKLTSSKTTWTWNASYQQLFDKAKSLIKSQVCMKFYDDTKPLYLETDASRVSLGAALLQIHDNMTYQKGIHQTTQSSTQLHLLAKGQQVQSGDIVTSHMRHSGYYTGWRSFTISASAGRYLSLQTTNHLYLC